MESTTTKEDFGREVQREIKVEGKFRKDKETTSIATARKIDDVELKAIEFDIENNLEVSTEDISAVRKKKLADLYGVASDKIDKEFVKRYDMPSEKGRWIILKELNTTNVEELLTKAKKEKTFLKTCRVNGVGRSKG